MTFDFQPYTREEFLDVAQEVITGQLGKDPDLACCVARRVVLRTKDVRQAIQVAKLCDSPEGGRPLRGWGLPGWTALGGVTQIRGWT